MRPRRPDRAHPPERRCSNPPCGPHSHATDKLHEYVERAIHAHYRFHRDQHYLMDNDKVVIIDEFTARRMPDRSTLMTEVVTWERGRN